MSGIPCQYLLLAEWSMSLVEVGAAATARVASYWDIEASFDSTNDENSVNEDDEGDEEDAEFVEYLESQAIVNAYHYGEQSFVVESGYESGVNETYGSDVDTPTQIPRTRGSVSPRKRSWRNSWDSTQS